jgi:hypothetical protein
VIEFTGFTAGMDSECPRFLRADLPIFSVWLTEDIEAVYCQPHATWTSEISGYMAW